MIPECLPLPAASIGPGKADGTQIGSLGLFAASQRYAGDGEREGDPSPALVTAHHVQKTDDYHTAGQ